MIRHWSGKGSRATTGGGLPLSLAGIDDDAAVLEAGDADAGPAAARQQRCVAVDVERQVMQRTQRGGDGERDLRAGTEAGVTRNRLFDDEPVLGANAETLAQCRQMRCGAFAFRPLDGGLARTRQPYHGLGLAERKSETAEPAPGAAAGIEKAEMETGGHAYGNGIRHLPPVGCIIHGRLGARTHDSRFHRQGKRARCHGTPYFGSRRWSPGIWRSR